MPRKISEDQTRKQMIDPQLEHAGWYLHGKLKAKMIGRQFENTVSSTAITLIKFAFLRAFAEASSRNRRFVRATAGYVWRRCGGTAVYREGSE